MNIEMNGRKIARIDYVDGPSGNPGSNISGAPAGEFNYCQGWMVFSATHHGDHDEFWIVFYDADGKELSRRNARTVEHIVWDTAK